MKIPKNYPKISKRDCKKHFKCVKNMVLFYNNAETLLKDAELLLSKKRNTSALICAQLALEDCGMAFHYLTLYYLVGEKNPKQYQDYLKLIKDKDNYKKHAFKVKSITDFRFRYWKNQKEMSQLFSKHFHEFRLRKTYLEMNKRTGVFENPKTTKKDVEFILNIAKHYMYS